MDADNRAARAIAGSEPCGTPGESAEEEDE